MSQTVTLTLPDRLYEPIRRIAQATHQPVEAVLLMALQTSLPALDGLPEPLIEALVALEMMDTPTLQQVLLEQVPVEQQRTIEALLRRNQAEQLTQAEQEQLTLLQQNADQVMLRKARAAVLLRFRGQRIPTVAELRQMTVAR
jgi:DNA-binding helix-hairpin-helix protein with protein kinase domain